MTAQGYAGDGNRVLFKGSGHQPDEQSVGTYDLKKKEILYYDAGYVVGYSRKDGSLTGTVTLPSSAKVYDVLNFSFANDYVFLFDQDSRKWIGYRIF